MSTTAAEELESVLRRLSGKGPEITPQNVEHTKKIVAFVEDFVDNTRKKIFIEYIDGQSHYISSFVDMIRKDISTIICDGLQVSYLPSDITKYVENCSVFIVTRCRLRELPKDLKLPNCQKFHVYQNNLEKLPQELQLHKCVDFDVSKNNLLNLPVNMGLRSCREFNASFNVLFNFPVGTDLVSCEKFDISKNHIDRLGRSWEPFVLPKCIDFDISMNRIHAFPDVMQLPVCQRFHAVSNCLLSLPSNFTLDECSTLNLTGNLLKELPKDMMLPKCKILLLTQNELTVVPDFSQIPVIERLDLRINSLKELPEWIYGAKNLTELGIYGNDDLALTQRMNEFVTKIAPPEKKTQQATTLFEVLNPDYKQQETPILERQEVCINWALERTLPKDLQKFGVDLQEIITDEKKDKLFEFMTPHIKYIKSVVLQTEKELVGEYNLENHKQLVEQALLRHNQL